MGWKWGGSGVQRDCVVDVLLYFSSMSLAIVPLL